MEKVKQRCQASSSPRRDMVWELPHDALWCLGSSTGELTRPAFSTFHVPRIRLILRFCSKSICEASIPNRSGAFHIHVYTCIGFDDLVHLDLARKIRLISFARTVVLRTSNFPGQAKERSTICVLTSLSSHGAATGQYTQVRSVIVSSVS